MVCPYIHQDESFSNRAGAQHPTYPSHGILFFFLPRILVVIWMVSDPIPESHAGDLLPRITSDTNWVWQGREVPLGIKPQLKI